LGPLGVGKVGKVAYLVFGPLFLLEGVAGDSSSQDPKLAGRKEAKRWELAGLDLVPSLA